VLVVANFDLNPQYLDLDALSTRGHFRFGQLQDLASGHTPALFNGRLVVPPHRFYWLSEQRPGLGL
jgi:amylosucrase